MKPGSSPSRSPRGLLRASNRQGLLGALAHAASRAVGAGRTGAKGTTGALQTLPDSTLLGFAAGSVGVATGFYLAKKPRLIVAAGIVPALVLAGAILLRPVPRAAPRSEPR